MWRCPKALEQCRSVGRLSGWQQCSRVAHESTHLKPLHLPYVAASGLPSRPSCS